MRGGNCCFEATSGVKPFSWELDGQVEIFSAMDVCIPPTLPADKTFCVPDTASIFCVAIPVANCMAKRVKSPNGPSKLEIADLPPSTVRTQERCSQI